MNKKITKNVERRPLSCKFPVWTLILDASKQGRGSEKAKIVRMVKIIRKSAEIKANPKSCYVAN